MKLVEIRLDAALWSSGSEARRDEWRVAMAELCEEHTFEAAGEDVTLHIELDPARSILRWTAPNQTEIARTEIPADAMRPQVSEYLGICRQIMALEQAASSPRLETLDMAKKLTHDQAARALAKLCANVGPDHPTSRRLFTLLLTLHVDTTKIHVVHTHRRR